MLGGEVVALLCDNDRNGCKLGLEAATFPLELSFLSHPLAFVIRILGLKPLVLGLEVVVLILESPDLLGKLTVGLPMGIELDLEGGLLILKQITLGLDLAVAGLPIRCILRPINGVVLGLSLSIGGS